MSKSTITLLNGATIAPTNDSLLKFCQDVNALNDAGMLEQVFATIVKPEPIAQTTPRVRKPQARKSDPTMRMTDSGKMMPADKGTMSDSQLARIARKCEALGEPLTDAEIKAMASWSMADASDFYASL
jgi:hypothetical protein